MAKVKESRFALLHVEDDSDEDSNQAVTKKGNQTNKNAPKKSKNKKKKNTQQAENEEVCLGLPPLSAICVHDNQFKFDITDTKGETLSNIKYPSVSNNHAYIACRHI